MRLDDAYIAKAIQDARRFQGNWDAGTSGSLAAHVYRVIKEREGLLATIDELEQKNRELRAAVESRLAATSDEIPIPPEVIAAFPGATFKTAMPRPPAEFKPTCISSTLPPKQLNAAWGAISEKSASVRERAEPIATRQIEARPIVSVIGIAGRAGSGKSTVATMTGRAVLQLADPLYAALATMLGVPEGMLRHQGYKATTIPGLDRTPRQLLQTLGTEWGRSCVGQDVWIRMLERRIAHFKAAGVSEVVVSDVRFNNEARWIREQGGQVWHVYRPGLESDGHASEAGVERHDDDVVIENSGNLEGLRAAVEAALGR